MRPKYRDLPTRCDLSLLALAEAAKVIGQSSEYQLHVSPGEVAYAMQMINSIGAFDLGVPFKPSVVITADNSLAVAEWFLSANGVSVGSRAP